MNVLAKFFGNYSKRELKRIQPLCDAVLALEEKYKAMSDAELKAQTPALKERLANGETLDDILPDAFAVCREGSARILEMRHFPVQIIGGIVLHQGRIVMDGSFREVAESELVRTIYAGGAPSAQGAEQ